MSRRSKEVGEEESHNEETLPGISLANCVDPANERGEMHVEEEAAQEETRPGVQGADNLERREKRLRRPLKRFGWE